jgi:uncharacterized lipoprotein YmbA
MMQIDNLRLRKLPLTILLAAVLFAGCRGSTPQVEFYALNSPSGITPIANPADAYAYQGISIGVGPVSIPEVLDRPQIVTRRGPNKLNVDDFHRWASRLEDNFARVLAKNISLLLPTDQVAVYPWDPGFKPQYQVTLDIQHFEGQWGREVLLEVFWKVIEAQGKTALNIRKTVVKEPLPGNDYETLVSIKSGAVTTLGQEIVQEIKQLQSGTKSN